MLEKHVLMYDKKKLHALGPSMVTTNKWTSNFQQKKRWNDQTCTIIIIARVAIGYDPPFRMCGKGISLKNNTFLLLKV